MGMWPFELLKVKNQDTIKTRRKGQRWIVIGHFFTSQQNFLHFYP